MGIETLMLAAAVASAASQAAGGLNALQMGKYQAATLRAQGEQARIDAGTQAQAQLEKSARVTGQGIVAAASSGGGGDGSALSVLEDLSHQSMAQARRSAVEGMAAGRAADAQAKAAKKQGVVKAATSLLGAAGTLLGGAMGAQQAGAQAGALRTMGQQQALNSAPAGFSLEGLY